MSRLEFVVYGVAQPQGSARAFMPKGARFPVVTGDNVKTKPWRDLIMAAVQDAVRAQAWTVPQDGVRLMAVFRLKRPKSLPKTKATPRHTRKPDLDKLTRAVGDALKGVVYNDDSQIDQLKVTKQYADVGQVPHAVIVVEA